MNKWIAASRLRTLPLSSSAVILGLACAFALGQCPADLLRVAGAVLTVLTAVVLQILSNYANDYGDQISGVDRSGRAGRVSLVQQGAMTMGELKAGILVTGALCLLLGLGAVTLCWWGDLAGFGSFILLGALAAVAAVTYTLGPSYSYYGLGDLFVFLFFGLVAVSGAECMLSHGFSLTGLLAGAGAGCNAILVLNVNNLRDVDSDSRTGKRSIPVRLGIRGGKIYHLAVFLLGSGFLLAAALMGCRLAGFFLVPMFIPLLRAVRYTVSPAHEGSSLEPMMRQTSVGASLLNFGLAFLLGAGCILG